MNYFKVKNYQKYQHYKERNPVWIKLYNAILTDYEFTLLSDKAKYQLIAINLLASRYQNKVPYDAKWIAQQISASDKIDLDELEKLGFIIPYEDASKMLADCYQNASIEKSREEKKREEKIKEPKISLQEWESKNGELNLSSFTNWIAKHSLNTPLLERELLTFRDSCVARGYKYIDFPAAFRLWVANEKYGNGLAKFKKRATI